MLSSTDIALMRASFARIVPIKEPAADLFYDRCGPENFWTPVPNDFCKICQEQTDRERINGVSSREYMREAVKQITAISGR